MSLKDDVLALVATLSSSQAAADVVPRLFDDVVRELSQAYSFDSALELVSITAGDATFTTPADAGQVLMVFYGTRVLPLESKLTMETLFGRDWASREGHPRAVVVEDESLRTFRLVPKPVQDSADYIPLFGSTPFAKDYPAFNVAVLYSRVSNDPPYYLKLPLTLEVLAREFERESDHRDLAFAQAARELAARSLTMVL